MRYVFSILSSVFVAVPMFGAQKAVKCDTYLTKIAYQAVTAALKVRYRVSVEGLDEIKARGNQGILFLGTHQGAIETLIDAQVLHKGFRPRAFGFEFWQKFPVVRRVVKDMNYVSIPSTHNEVGRSAASRIKAMLGEVSSGLSQGDNFILYPGISQPLTKLGNNSSVHRIRKEFPSVRLVAMRNYGVWGSVFTRGGNQALFGNDKRYHWGKSALHVGGTLLKNGIVFLPKRDIRVKFTELNLATGLSREELNQQVENELNGINDNDPIDAMTYYPYSFWEKGGARFSSPDGTRSEAP